MFPPEKPHEAARQIDPERHFPPPESHPHIEIPQEVHQAIQEVADAIAQQHPPVGDQIHFLEIPPEVRWYTYQFLPTGDLISLVDTSEQLKDEMASFSQQLALHSFYTLEGARQFSNADHPTVAGDRVHEEEVPLQTLMLLQRGFAVRELDPEFLKNLVNTCDFVDDATLLTIIRLCLPDGEIDIPNADVDNEEVWTLLINYINKLRSENRLEEISATVSLSGAAADTILRWMLGGMVRRTPPRQ